MRRAPYGGIPELRPENRTVRLAEGSISRRLLGSVSLNVQGGNTGIEKIDFYVMEAPCNLLSRYAMEKLWPAHFKALRQVTSVPAVNRNTGRKVMIDKPTEVSNKTEMKATKIKKGNVVPVPMKRTIFTEPVNHCTDTVTVPVKDTTAETQAVASRKNNSITIDTNEKYVIPQLHTTSSGSDSMMSQC